MVISVPDARLGANICACIVPEEGFQLHTDDMLKCFADLYQTDEGLGITPAYFMFMSSLPTFGGKIDRKQLKKMAIEHFNSVKLFCCASQTHVLHWPQSAFNFGWYNFTV